MKFEKVTLNSYVHALNEGICAVQAQQVAARWQAIRYFAVAWLIPMLILGGLFYLARFSSFRIETWQGNAQINEHLNVMFNLFVMSCTAFVTVFSYIWWIVSDPCDLHTWGALLSDSPHCADFKDLVDRNPELVLLPPVARELRVADYLLSQRNVAAYMDFHKSSNNREACVQLHARMCV